MVLPFLCLKAVVVLIGFHLEQCPSGIRRAVNTAVVLWACFNSFSWLLNVLISICPSSPSVTTKRKTESFKWAFKGAKPESKLMKMLEKSN